MMGLFPHLMLVFTHGSLGNCRLRSQFTSSCTWAYPCRVGDALSCCDCQSEGPGWEVARGECIGDGMAEGFRWWPGFSPWPCCFPSVSREATDVQVDQTRTYGSENDFVSGKTCDSYFTWSSRCYIYIYSM